MSDQLSVAKQLLKKGIALSDPELISMANDLITSLEPKQQVPVKPEQKKRGRKPKVTVVETEPEERPITTTGNKIKTRNKKEPIKANPKWIDLGGSGEEKPEDIITPKIRPVPRQRESAKKIEQYCNREHGGCGKMVETPAYLKREIFVCEKCILRRRGK